LNTPKKKKILVVEDNRAMLNFLIKTLEREGHQVVSAQDGLSALDILTSFTPDIMLFDLIMPNIDGRKLCQIVRRMQHLAGCYIIILSAAVAEMDFDYVEIGADTYIAKGPFRKMAEYVLTAVKESDTCRMKEKPKHIIGLDDVHARQITKELLSRNRHMETILDNITEGILELYSKRVVYANSTAVSLLSVPQEELLGASLPDVFDKIAGSKTDLELLLKLITDNSFEIDQNASVEINKRQVIFRSMPVKEEALTTIILIKDVTERKRMQLQLQHAQKMETIGTITSGVAHNFRNTLAGILSNCEVIQLNYKDDAKLNEIVERIRISGERGAQLVNGLMQFSRKHTKEEFKRLNLSMVIQESYYLIKETFDKRIDIRIDIPESLPIMGDQSALDQALINIYTNAQDAMPEGGEMRIEAMQEGNTAVVIVSDTGKGMDRITVERCFDPFFTTKKVCEGTGMGLSTTYGTIKSHKGEIRVNSEPNKGSVFKLFLPLNIPEKQDK
jgi:signal transduction histidine kinase/ActR/RegA family two-component response regulator